MIVADLNHGSTGAEAFVESLNALGVEQIFFNPGGDTISLQGTIAKYRAAGKKTPRMILCLHESVAVAAAHGYAMVSGRPQVVVVFQDVGTLQGGGALVNLRYGRVPVIVCAGRNPTPNCLNWLGEPCDQRRIMRDYVKWDHELHADENITSALQEAFRVASTEPWGPVYLSIDRKVMTEKVGERSVAAPIKSGNTFEIDMGTLRKAAEVLIDSENPLIMSSYAGRHPESVAPLVELAEALGARVITTDLRMNFPSAHSLCPGIDGYRGEDYDHYIAEADVVLLIDYDFPGLKIKSVAPRADAKIIHIDIEPLKRGKPLWDRPADIIIEGDSNKVLPHLAETIRRRLIAKPDVRFRDRFRRLENEHRKLKDEWRAKAMNESKQRPITADWLCYCVNEAIGEDAILLHMAPTSGLALSRQIRRTKPGTLYCWGVRLDASGGSMGWPMGAALGAKLAAPDKMVISIIGDGGFIYGSPVAALCTASGYNAPFLTIVCNNQMYGAIRQSLRRECGEHLPGEMGIEVGADFKMPPNYALIAKACNAYGQTVEDPSELLGALKNAIDEVRRGRPAVLDVRQ